MSALPKQGVMPKVFRKRAFHRALKRGEPWALRAPKVGTFQWAFWWTYPDWSLQEQLSTRNFMVDKINSFDELGRPGGFVVPFNLSSKPE